MLSRAAPCWRGWWRLDSWLRPATRSSRAPQRSQPAPRLRHRVLEALAHQQESPKRDLVEQLQLEVSDCHTVGDTLADLRRLAAMPPQTDHLYVVDVRHVLRGIVPVPVLLVSEPATLITDLMREEVVTFSRRCGTARGIDGLGWRSTSRPRSSHRG